MRLALALLLVAAPVAAEFSDEEKYTASQLAQFSVSLANVAYYVADEARSSGNASNHALYSGALVDCLEAGREAWQAAGWIVGSVSINGNTPDVNDPDVRLERAEHFFSRVPGDLSTCRDSIDDMIAAGASTYGLATIARDRIIPHLEGAHPALLADLQDAIGPDGSAVGFLDPDPPEWPFFVRRPPAFVVGLHGDFEVAVELVGRGIGYFHDAALRVALAWRDQPYAGGESDVRSYMLQFRDGMRKAHTAQMIHYHFIPCDARTKACTPDQVDPPQADQFSRLLEALDQARQWAKHFRNGQQFYMTDLLDAGYDLSSALERQADGWFNGVDEYVWEAQRFPCIEGYPSRCEELGLE